MPKHLEDQISCLKVKGGNKNNSLEKAMQQMVEDEVLRTRLSENAFALFLEQHTAAIMFRNTYEV